MSILQKLASPSDANHCLTCSDQQAITEAGPDTALAKRCPACFATCAECGGKGIRFERDWTNSLIAHPCRCADVDRRIALFNDAGIPAKHASVTIESAVDVTESVRAAKLACLKKLEGFSPGDPGLCFLGLPGRGKTHLAVAMIRDLTLKRGFECRFVEFTHLLDELKAGFDSGSSGQRLMAAISGTPVLVVDELGKELDTDWRLTILDELISRRYNAGRTTYFTSNYVLVEPPEIPRDLSKEKYEITTLESRIGARMFSRLQVMCEFVTIDAPDFRKTGGAGASGA